MVKIASIDNSILTKAFIAWSGYGRSAGPRRDPSFVAKVFGSKLSIKLMEKIEALESDFYSSNARHIASNLKEMDALASAQFMDKHPEIPNEIVKILS